MPPAFRRVALAAAQAAYDKKAGSLSLYYLGASNPLGDYVLIMTGLSKAHMETLELEIEKTLKLSGLLPIRRARPRSAQWLVLDYGDLVVHIMSAEARDFYRLERLHSGARRIHFTKRPTRGPAPFMAEPPRPS